MSEAKVQTDVVLIPTKVYFLNGKHTCSANVNDGSQCQHLWSRKMGCDLYCGVTGDSVFYEEGVLIPSSGCPLKEYL